MRIVTKYTTNASGQGQILAKGHGRQRTVPFDHSKSIDWNHGNAAGTLALVFDVSWHYGIGHTVQPNGSHSFIL